METLTLREIERESGIGWKRLAYAASTYGIEPVRRVGLVKLYDRVDVPRRLAAARRVGERSGDRR